MGGNQGGPRTADFVANLKVSRLWDLKDSQGPINICLLKGGPSTKPILETWDHLFDTCGLKGRGAVLILINQCLVDPWVQQRANKSWELFASRVNTQTGSESFCGICWTLVWENYDSHVGWDIKQRRWEAKLMRLFSQELNIFSWGLEYLDDSQPLIFATTQTFAQSKSDRRHQGSS